MTVKNIKVYLSTQYINSFYWQQTLEELICTNFLHKILPYKKYIGQICLMMSLKLHGIKMEL
jgi:hypothetical protein